jgi:hypothetical protein
MRDILPPGLLDSLRDRYLAGVADAESLFGMHRADEDTLTGALGQAIASRDPYTFSTENRIYLVRTEYYKIRGRGRNAPERMHGVDGIFQISVTQDSGHVIRRKGLPFQAKKNWRGKNAALRKQAELMANSLGGGLVVDYTANGYKACDAHAVVERSANRRLLEASGALQSLGQVLGGDFLECRIGRPNLYFDPEREKFVEAQIAEPLLHIIDTGVFVKPKFET